MKSRPARNLLGTEGTERDIKDRCPVAPTSAFSFRRTLWLLARVLSVTWLVFILCLPGVASLPRATGRGPIDAWKGRAIALITVVAIAIMAFWPRSAKVRWSLLPFWCIVLLVLLATVLGVVEITIHL